MKTFIGLKNILWELNMLSSKETTFPHILFTGPRGSGKTQLSKYIGEKLELPFIEINAPALDKKKLYATLLTLKPNSILFIDEIHRLHPAVEEVLYQPLENQTLTVPFRNRLVTVKFVPFTLIGATTRPALLSKPLLSRFKIQINLPRYSVRELARIILQKYEQFTRRDALTIAQYTMVPREALGLALRVLNLNKQVRDALEFLDFKKGFSRQEREYLKIIHTANISLKSIATYLQLDDDSVQLIEERLMNLGLLEITGRGRQLTHKGLQKLSTL